MAWWTHAIGSIPAGIVWTYLMARVPKRGAAFIAGAIMALLGFVMAWPGRARWASLPARPSASLS